MYAYHRDLHVLTHSFPTRRSSDLLSITIFRRCSMRRAIRVPSGRRWNSTESVGGWPSGEKFDDAQIALADHFHPLAPPLRLTHEGGGQGLQIGRAHV